MSSLAQLNADQAHGLTTLLSTPQNVFITGAAGTGKSHLIKAYLKARADKAPPILASTGAAAILVGGRTFHSFFGLGILEGGATETISKAIKNRRVVKRLCDVNEVIIDEISMISGPVLSTAESIARLARESDRPWGGLRVIAVGDFSQLPPVNVYNRQHEWAFLDETWRISDFKPVLLNEVMRSQNRAFLEILGDVRQGHLNNRVKDFLASRTRPVPASFAGTKIFSRKVSVDEVNLRELTKLPGDPVVFETRYSGQAAAVEKFKKNSPLPERLFLKRGARVMLRTNDPQGRWVNGSLGHVEGYSSEFMSIKLLNGKVVEIEQNEFTLLDADGKPVASARNFPINLAWAITIHKSQGATVDQAIVDLKGLWEPGQAYVALSRLKDPENLYISGWDERSIFASNQVLHFYNSLY